jgi:hypothetical protein
MAPTDGRRNVQDIVVLLEIDLGLFPGFLIPTAGLILD